MVSALRSFLTALFLVMFIVNSNGAQLLCAPPNHCTGLASACECGGAPNSAPMAACAMTCQMQVPGTATSGPARETVTALLYSADVPGTSGQLIAPPVPPPRLA